MSVRTIWGHSPDADGLLAWMRENNGYIFHRQVTASGWTHETARELITRGDVERRKARHKDDRTSFIYVLTDMDAVTPRHAALDQIAYPELVPASRAEDPR